MDNNDGNNNAQTQQSNSTHERGEEDGGGGDSTGDDESLDGVVAVSLMSNADASGDKVVIYDEGDGGKLATTKAAMTMKAEQQSATKRGWWRSTHCNMVLKWHYCSILTVIIAPSSGNWFNLLIAYVLCIIYSPE
jgi:hypothetical protein